MTVNSRPLSDRELVYVRSQSSGLSIHRPWATVADSVVRLCDEVERWRASKEVWVMDSLPKVGDPVVLRSGKLGKITSISVVSEEAEDGRTGSGTDA